MTVNNGAMIEVDENVFLRSASITLVRPVVQNDSQRTEVHTGAGVWYTDESLEDFLERLKDCGFVLKRKPEPEPESEETEE